MFVQLLLIVNGNFSMVHISILSATCPSIFLDRSRADWRMKRSYLGSEDDTLHRTTRCNARATERHAHVRARTVRVEFMNERAKGERGRAPTRFIIIGTSGLVTPAITAQA